MKFIWEVCQSDHEYMELVQDILNNEDFLKLDEITHHHYTTRLRHSMYVSYLSYKLAKTFNLNTKAIARAGLLHDYFHENREDIAQLNQGSHNYIHPKLALENAKQLTELSELEEDIILKHMFLCTKCSFPRYKESMIVTSMDKYCAIAEVSSPLRFRIKNRMSDFFRKIKLAN